MKKTILFATLSLLSMLAICSSTSAQTLGNKTNCDMIFDYYYAPIGSCTPTGYMQTIVPAHTAMPSSIPAGTEIIIAKGTYVAGGCGAFYIGLPCSGFPTNDAISCGTACGSYNASYFPGYVVTYY